MSYLTQTALVPSAPEAWPIRVQGTPHELGYRYTVFVHGRALVTADPITSVKEAFRLAELKAGFSYE